MSTTESAASPARLSVTIAEIDEQRRLGWPDFHPEDYCHRCGGINVPSWSVDSDRFNAALGPYLEQPYNGIVCPGCFARLHEAATGLTVTWQLVPGGHFSPSRRAAREEAPRL
jgi:hypothetical protein